MKSFCGILFCFSACYYSADEEKLAVTTIAAVFRLVTV